MKRYGNLWPALISWENLVLAARKAQRGKRRMPAARAFNFALETELLKIQRELQSGDYRPGAFRTHWITRPKPRLISAAPYRDRVVHHALMNVLEPILDRHFHPYSFACRHGKGTHAAADRLQLLMRRYRFAVQCDVRQFFPSIDHEIIKGVFRRVIKDQRVLALMDMIVDGSNKQPGSPCWFAGDDLFTPGERRRGLPIGNLTSQWFANWMLNGLDHYVTSHLRIGGYVRYCDDFILLHDDRAVLKDALERVKNYLAGCRLELHGRRAVIRPVRAGMTFVGYRIWPTHRLLRKSNIRDMRRRVRWMKRAYREGTISWKDIKPRLAAWIGHARQAKSERLIRRLSREWTFTRAGTDGVSGYSGRVVGQQRQQLHVYEPQQQHAGQPQQQLRFPASDALSGNSAPYKTAWNKFQARNRMVYGLCESGLESPGSIPVSTVRVMRPSTEFMIASRLGLVGESRTPQPALYWKWTNAEEAWAC